MDENKSTNKLLRVIALLIGGAIVIYLATASIWP
jgi:hypothetical protein